MAKLEQIMLDDGPAVVPLWRALFALHGQEGEGLRLHPSVYIDVYKIWIDA